MLPVGLTLRTLCVVLEKKLNFCSIKRMPNNVDSDNMLLMMIVIIKLLWIFRALWGNCVLHDFSSVFDLMFLPEACVGMSFISLHLSGSWKSWRKKTCRMCCEFPSSQPYGTAGTLLLLELAANKNCVSKTRTLELDLSVHCRQYEN